MYLDSKLPIQMRIQMAQVMLPKVKQLSGRFDTNGATSHHHDLEHISLLCICQAGH